MNATMNMRESRLSHDLPSGYNRNESMGGGGGNKGWTRTDGWNAGSGDRDKFLG